MALLAGKGAYGTASSAPPLTYRSTSLAKGANLSAQHPSIRGCCKTHCAARVLHELRFSPDAYLESRWSAPGRRHDFAQFFAAAGR